MRKFLCVALTLMAAACGKPKEPVQYYGGRAMTDYHYGAYVQVLVYSSGARLIQVIDESNTLEQVMREGYDEDGNGSWDSITLCPVEKRPECDAPRRVLRENRGEPDADLLAASIEFKRLFAEIAVDKNRIRNY